MRRTRTGRLRASLRPVATPLLAGLIAIALLCGVGMVALRDSSQALQHDAQARILANRDSAIRAISRQAADLMRTIDTYAGTPAVIGGLTKGGEKQPPRSRWACSPAARGRRR